MATKKKSASKGEQCWNGYEPVPGKEPFSKGSCKPAGAAGKSSPAAKKKTVSKKTTAAKKTATKKTASNQA